jgi:hypothetical protein
VSAWHNRHTWATTDSREILKVTFRASKIVLELIKNLITYCPQLLDTLGLPGAQRGTHNFVQIAENFGHIHFLVGKIGFIRILGCWIWFWPQLSFGK